MRLFLILILVLGSLSALAHPNGTYRIDNNDEVTVTIGFVKRCPRVEGALRGSLRTLTFSEAATDSPYNFITELYVEKHVTDGEVYVQTDNNCVPVENGEEYPATKNTFDEYAFERIE
jgi:hypothetical protein